MLPETANGSGAHLPKRNERIKEISRRLQRRILPLVAAAVCLNLVPALLSHVPLPDSLSGLPLALAILSFGLLVAWGEPRPVRLPFVVLGWLMLTGLGVGIVCGTVFNNAGYEQIHGQKDLTGLAPAIALFLLG